MNKFMKWLEESFAPKADKVFSRPWISSIGKGMQKMVPFVLVYAVASIYGIIRQYITFVSLPDISVLADYTIDMIGFFVAFFIAHEIERNTGHRDNAVNAGILSVLIFFMTIMPQGESANDLSSLLSMLGGSGIANALVSALFTCCVFNNFSKIGFLKDNDSIPDFLITWINTTIPAFIAMLITMVVRFGFGVDITGSIMSVFTPLIKIGQTLPGFVILCTLPAIFYTMGVSTWVWAAVIGPVVFTAMADNMALVEAGKLPIYITNYANIYMTQLVWMGGCGATLALNILMILSKSKSIKAKGKVFLVPSLVNINEPIIFGAPVVFQPLLMLSTILCTICNAVVVYLIQSIGWLNIPYLTLGTGHLPAPICTFLETQDWRAIPWYFVLLTLDLLITLPFFKAWEYKETKPKETEEN